MMYSLTNKKNHNEDIYYTIILFFSHCFSCFFCTAELSFGLVLFSPDTYG